MNLDLNIVASYKVLVIGDAILDRYRYVGTLGRGTKEAILSVNFEREEEFKGGVWASASHLTDLVKQVDIWHGERVTINIKYIGPYNVKLFSVHSSEDRPNGFYPVDIGIYDAVVVFDYGYGFLSSELRQRITAEARFLAVNAQSNSTNYGFNRINEKWPFAHFAVCDELEARLAAHDQDSPMEDIILKLPYRSIIVTQGSHGAIGFANREFYREKALTDRPVDLLGAGDAVLAVVAPFAKAGCSIQQLVHLGNVAGMIKVGILGHRGHVTKAELEKYL